MWGKLGALSACGAACFGAQGAHRNEWDVPRRQSFMYAQLYHFAAAFGLMHVGSKGMRRPWAAGALLVAGSALFSGSLYHRCFTNERQPAHRLAPIGGACLMAGFLALAVL